MIQIEIRPLSGILIQTIGELKLGMARVEIENLIGPPNSLDSISINNLKVNRAFYDSFELRIDYNKKGTVEFIEFIFGPFPEKTELKIYTVDPFKIDATELLEILSTHNLGRINDSEAPYCYAFENISVGIWRQTIPSDIIESINEKKANDQYEIDKKQLEEELQKSNHFWTIGIGIENYYSS